jgi:hypothetical protein
MKSKILDKLNKLIAHAESAKAIGSTAEGKAFEGKIRKLLDDNGLTMADVELHQDLNGPIQAEPVNDPSEPAKDWHIHLLGAIGLVNGCTAALRGDGVMFVIGRKVNREKTVKLFQRLAAVCNEMSEEYAVEPSANPISFQLSLGYSSSSRGTRPTKRIAGLNRISPSSATAGISSNASNAWVPGRRFRKSRTERKNITTRPITTSDAV